MTLYSEFVKIKRWINTGHVVSLGTNYLLKNTVILNTSIFYID